MSRIVIRSKYIIMYRKTKLNGNIKKVTQTVLFKVNIKK